ncbi:MAG: FKBP-type peptidyl-prolyl cis-trans isomerase [bacterium]|nr:FKBP-type peptidyl-prolyl cis-trans isomerase [bacterium]
MLRPRGLCVLLLCLIAGSTVLAGEPALESDDDKVLYTLGVALSRNLASFEFNEDEMKKIVAGLTDGALARDPRVDPTTFGPKIDAMMQARMATIQERQKAAGAAYLAEAGKEEGATTDAAGMVYLKIDAGDGAQPGPNDGVKVHYRGTLPDGRVFDDSRGGPQPGPATFNVSGVIPCFSQGLQKMKVGGKSKLTCPPELAYGDRGSPPSVPPGATLQFTVELIEIVSNEPPAEPQP